MKTMKSIFMMAAAIAAVSCAQEIMPEGVTGNTDNTVNVELQPMTFSAISSGDTRRQKYSTSSRFVQVSTIRRMFSSESLFLFPAFTNSAEASTNSTPESRFALRRTIMHVEIPVPKNRFGGS